MRNLLKKAKNLITVKEGASNVEIIVWISVVLVIATVLFMFRDAIIQFINNAIGQINNFRVS